MSKIYDFIYTGKYRFENYHIYIFLEVSNECYWLDCFLNGNIYRVEITDKIDGICQKLYDMNIQAWNLQNFDSPMYWFPSFEWKLVIHTDSVNINCMGTDEFPTNWESFIDILNYIGIKF
jgi:hypothetical protein